MGRGGWLLGTREGCWGRGVGGGHGGCRYRRFVCTFFVVVEENWNKGGLGIGGKGGEGWFMY